MPPHFSSPKNLSALFSELFEIVSQSGKRFFIHSDVLTAQSEPFRNIAAKGKLDLSDWDEDTVGRLIQYLYVGDYQVPGKVSDEGEAGEGDEEGGVRGTRRSGANTPDTVQSLVDREEEGVRVTGMLMAHMKVYALAKNKGIETLRLMALERLRAGLEGIDEHSSILSVTTNFVELLNYANYNPDHTDSRTTWDKPTRDLMSTFAARNLEKLASLQEMESLLSRGGGFVVELVEKVSRRLYGAEGSCAEQRFYDGKEVFEMQKKLLDKERGVQEWKSRAVASDEKLRESEAASAKKVQQLKAANAEIQQLETTIEQLEASYLEEVQQSKASNLKEVQRLVATNKETVQQLEAAHEKIQQLETRLEESEVANSEEVQQLKASNLEEVQKLEAASVEELRRLEVSNAAKVKWLEKVIAIKVRQLEAANAKGWRLETEVQKLESNWRWLETVYPEKAKQREMGKMMGKMSAGYETWTIPDKVPSAISMAAEYVLQSIV